MLRSLSLAIYAAPIAELPDPPQRCRVVSERKSLWELSRGRETRERMMEKGVMGDNNGVSRHVVVQGDRGDSKSRERGREGRWMEERMDRGEEGG